MKKILKTNAFRACLTVFLLAAVVGLSHWAGQAEQTLQNWGRDFHPQSYTGVVTACDSASLTLSLEGGSELTFRYDEAITDAHMTASLPEIGPGLPVWVLGGCWEGTAQPVLIAVGERREQSYTGTIVFHGANYTTVLADDTQEEVTIYHPGEPYDPSLTAGMPVTVETDVLVWGEQAEGHARQPAVSIFPR